MKYKALPWKELSMCLPGQKSSRGSSRWLSNQGMLAMMFLKHHLNVSDKQLIERFNTDWFLQVLCGKLLSNNEQMRDYNLPSVIRGYIRDHVDLSEL